MNLNHLKKNKSNKYGRMPMTEEYESIMQNDVWEVVPRPHGKSVVTSKWMFKIKHRMDGSIGKYKARFVARGPFALLLI